MHNSSKIWGCVLAQGIGLSLRLSKRNILVYREQRVPLCLEYLSSHCQIESHIWERGENREYRGYRGSIDNPAGHQPPASIEDTLDTGHPNLGRREVGIWEAVAVSLSSGDIHPPPPQPHSWQIQPMRARDGGGTGQVTLLLDSLTRRQDLEFRFREKTLSVR